MLFVLGSLIGFPVLIFGLAILLCAKFASEVSISKVALIPVFSGSSLAGGDPRVSFKSRSWLARHEHSPSGGLIVSRGRQG